VRGGLWGLAAAEAALFGVGLAWAWLRGIPLPFGFSPGLLLLTLAAGFVLTGLNLCLYHRLRRRWRSARVIVFLEEEVFPIFRGASTLELSILLALAGLGEEVFFRGVLQSETGLVPASLVFGLAHGPTPALVGLAVWAAAMGLALGGLYLWSGSLAVPVLVHAAYDLAALVYVRRRLKAAEEARSEL